MSCIYDHIFICIIKQLTHTVWPDAPSNLFTGIGSCSSFLRSRGTCWMFFCGPGGPSMAAMDAEEMEMLKERVGGFCNLENELLWWFQNVSKMQRIVFHPHKQLKQP